MTEPKHMRETARISECDCDFMRRMTAGSILRLVQIVGTSHADTMGLTYETHRKSHTAFVLAKMSLQAAVPIVAGETVTVDTYPSSAQRAVFHRYSTLRLSDGTLAAAVDARWVLLDTQRGKILRDTPEEMGLSLKDLPVVAAHDLRFPKPDKLELLGEESATYSRCDQNRHINNTRYADIVCGHIPLAAFEEDFLRRLVILYHREVPMGERVALFGGQAGPGDYYFSGDREGTNCFQAFASFQPVIMPELTL